MKKEINFLLIFLILFYKTISSPDIYPKKKDIKGIQPDFVDPNQIIGNGVSTVAFNFPWFVWEPTKKSKCSPSEYSYKDSCYRIDHNTVNQIRRYTNAGLTVTGILYGVPNFARCDCPIKNKIFCYQIFIEISMN